MVEWSAQFKSELILLHIWPMGRIYVLNSLRLIREAMLSPESADALSGRLQFKYYDENINPGSRGECIIYYKWFEFASKCLYA